MWVFYDSDWTCMVCWLMVQCTSIAETECYKQQRPLSWHTDMFIVSQALHRIRQIICCTKDMHIEKIKKYNLVIVNILHWADKGKQTSLSEQLQKLYCFNLVFCLIMITCPQLKSTLLLITTCPTFCPIDIVCLH